jgi:hypothetical protein
MPILTRQQIEELAQIIRQHASWLTWRLFGDRYISESDIQKLKDKDILPMDVQVDAIKHAFILGELESLLKHAEWKGLTWEQLQEVAQAPHSDVERLQIEAAELSALTVLRGLEDEIRNGLYDSLAQTTQAALSEGHVTGIVRDEVKLGVDLSKRFDQVAIELADRTKEVKRNWHRVAATELHAARQNGIVHAIVTGTDVYKYSRREESKVSVVPDPGACADCRRLYLGPGGRPIIFKLSDLLNNSGTNYVRPWRQNAQPVIPPLHPNCFCTLRYVPDGYDWGDRGHLEMTDPDAVIAAGERAKEIEEEDADR